MVAWLGRLSARTFLPIRRAAGPLHRRRPALSAEQEEAQKNLPPLPPPWSSDERWYRADFPPHRHNTLRPLPHGSTYFGDLVQSLARAGKRVTVAGWCLTPLMPLLRGRDEAGSSVAEVLRDVSERAEVYVLLWSGAPAFFEPNERAVEKVRETLLSVAPKVRCALDHRARVSHDHHQKAVTVDGRIAYVGGMDLSTFQGDRWDTPEHPLRLGPSWHDVQLRLEGEIVADVETNFLQRWEAVTGERLESVPASVDPTWNTPAQLLRTVPRGFYPFAEDGHFGIRHGLLAGIRHARRFVYLENQYIWSPEIVDALRRAMDRNGDAFRIVLVLPERAYSGRYDNDEHVRALREADAGRGIFQAYSLVSGGPAEGVTGYRFAPIYVHAKVCIVDDEWLSVGSANLNRRGLALDTEMNVQAVAPTTARELREWLWAEHLGLSHQSVSSSDPIDLIDDRFPSVATELQRCRSAGLRPCPGHAQVYVPGGGPTYVLDRLQSALFER